MSTNVTLYRDHPSEGWPSMDRYAESLYAGLQQVSGAGWHFDMPMPPAPWSGGYLQLLNRTSRYLLWARNLQGDINHLLDHSYGHLLYVLDPERTMVTIHDVAPLRFIGRRWGASSLAWRYAWRGLQRVRHIIVVSHFAAEEVRVFLDVPDVTIHVVHQAVAPHFQPQSDAVTAAIRSRCVPNAEHLILHVGNMETRKNLPALLEAQASLRSQGLPVVLLQIGGHPPPDILQLIDKLALTDYVRFLGRLHEDALVAYYSAADLFVFPSLYEGFGLPVLEAMACGTPVVASNAASLPEVVGNAGIMVDPESVSKLSEAMASVLTSQELAVDLRRRGLKHVQKFTWEQTATKTLAAYESIVADDGRR